MQTVLSQGLRSAINARLDSFLRMKRLARIVIKVYQKSSASNARTIVIVTSAPQGIEMNSARAKRVM